jgi:hypothetical protein
MALKRAAAGSVSQVQCGGVSEKGWFGMVETKSFFPERGGLSNVPSKFSVVASMPCSRRNILLCSCCQDAA